MYSDDNIVVKFTWSSHHTVVGDAEKFVKVNPLEINSIVENRSYSSDRVKELAFLLNDGVYYMNLSDYYSFLVIETDNFYGFIAPETEVDDDDYDE